MGKRYDIHEKFPSMAMDNDKTCASAWASKYSDNLEV